MTFKTVLFDLDGTLTDSGPGIMNSVRYTLKKYNMDVEDVSTLRSFIGPPLQEQLRKYCNLSLEESARALSYYREYYTEKGIYENSVYEGIPELLRALKEAGLELAVATSKPEHYAKIILEYFGIIQYFDVVGGACMDGSRAEKAKVIEYVLESCCTKNREQILMVGDRHYDIDGAKDTGIRSIGVLFGYGTRKELEEAGADWLIESPKDAISIIL